VQKFKLMSAADQGYSDLCKNCPVFLHPLKFDHVEPLHHAQNTSSGVLTSVSCHIHNSSANKKCTSGERENLLEFYYATPDRFMANKLTSSTFFSQSTIRKTFFLPSFRFGIKSIAEQIVNEAVVGLVEAIFLLCARLLCTQFNCKSHRRTKQLIPIVILLISARRGKERLQST
jgi:hypothetical protein